MTEATPRPWAWEAIGPGEGDITLGGATDPAGEFHVLTPHVCPSCSASHDRCLAPSEADAALIVTAVNSYDRLVAIEKAARRPVSDFAEPQDETDDPWGDRALAKWFDNLQAILEGASE